MDDRPAPSGSTRLAGVIGWPIRHSISPAIHNAAYRATGLDWVYVAFPVAAGHVGAALAGVRALGIEGLSVTMPHKQAVIGGLDALTGDAVALGAVNSIVRDGERLVGDNTDGGGFLDSLRLDEGIDPAGMRCVVVGAGGAARAVARALAGAGAERIAVLNRTPARAEAVVTVAGAVGAVATAHDLTRADLVVQATSVGMGTDPAMPVDPGVLASGTVVCDLVYHPRRTPLLAACEERGLRTIGGLGMLVHQAGRQFRAWTGLVAPLATMRDAAEAAEP